MKIRSRENHFKSNIVVLIIITCSFILLNRHYFYSYPRQDMSFRVVKRYGTDATKISLEGKENTFSTFFTMLKKESSFRESFNNLLAKFSLEYGAYFFECPPVNAKNAELRKFEFVLRKSKTLTEVKPNPRAFSSHLPPKDTYGTAIFPNLGRDAVLVAPSDAPANADYGHLASFVRNAPSKQAQIFWRDVATATLSRIREEKDRPVWISTSGLGISWLHIRLDSRPKYYTHDEYKTFRVS